MKKPNGYWTKERCKEKALEYTTKKEFREGCMSAYTYATVHKCLDEICEHMELIGNIYKRCVYVYQFENKYVYIGLTFNLEKRHQQHLKHGTCYKHMIVTNQMNVEPRVISNGYISVEGAVNLERITIGKYLANGYSVLNIQKAGGLGGSPKWTKDKIIEVIKLITKRREFLKKYPGAYSAAKRLGIFNVLTKHLPNAGQGNKILRIKSKQYLIQLRQPKIYHHEK